MFWIFTFGLDRLNQSNGVASDLVGHSRENVGLGREFRVGFEAAKFG